MSTQQTTKQNPDVTVENHGSIFTFELHTYEARAWVDDYVEVPDYMWQGSARFACEHRLAYDIAQGMLSSGLVVV